MLNFNTRGVPAPSGEETTIVEWVAEEGKVFSGFLVSGSASAEVRLYVGDGPDPWYVAQLSPYQRSITVADRAQVLPAGTKVRLVVFQETGQAQIYKGTLLGG